MDTLIGLTFGKWCSLLLENRFRIHPSKLPKAIILTILSLRNSYYRRKEEAAYGEKINMTRFDHPPIFILGHWRSGTTLLHNILTLDPQFVYPNILEIYNPHTFLIFRERLSAKGDFNRLEKRPMDNVEVSPLSPGEEEFALNILSLKSPILAWNFPRKEKYYDRYLTFQEVSSADLEVWKNAYFYFLKKITFFHQGKQLLLKSPPNTARIRLLLEMFPDAKFIHIHRNPAHVFQSTLKLYKNTVANFSFQKLLPEDKLIEGIIRRYQSMYEAFFQDIKQIPQGNFIDIAFEELEKDFYGVVERIYETLNLPGFQDFSLILKQRLAEFAQYKKNEYPPLNETILRELRSACPGCFERWEY